MKEKLDSFWEEISQKPSTPELERLKEIFGDLLRQKSDLQGANKEGLFRRHGLQFIPET